MVVTITHCGVPGGIFSEGLAPKNLESKKMAKTANARNAPQCRNRSLFIREDGLEDRTAYGGG